MDSREIQNKLLSYWFMQSYTFSSGVESTPEEEDFINNNIFKVMVTNGTKNKGYETDRLRVKECLELNTPYTLDSMSVSQSSSNVYLKEFPGKPFNSVNFEYSIEDGTQPNNKSMDTVRALLINTKENLKMRLWWAEEHDKEQQYIEEIPTLQQQILEIDEALMVLFGVM